MYYNTKTLFPSTVSVLFLLVFYEKMKLEKITNYGGAMVTNKDISRQYSVFSSNIKYYRKHLNYTQEMLAEKADLSISYIKQIESRAEYSNVTFITLSKLAMALNVTIKDLFIEKK